MTIDIYVYVCKMVLLRLAKANRNKNRQKSYAYIKEGVRMEQKREYTYSDEMGDAKIAVYSISAGVEVAYVTAHMGSLDFGLFEKSVQRHYVGIHYCKEGRIEQALNGDFLYLMPGDCVIAMQDRKIKDFSFPMKHYHGISLGIDLAEIKGGLRDFLEDNELLPREIAGRICEGKNYVVLRKQSGLQTFFAELYGVPERQREEYLKIKLPELFFLLKHLNIKEMDGGQQMVSRAQVELVKKIAAFISAHINEKITLKALTLQFGVSETYLQASFRCVYGMPVISFIRAQKMQSAAQILIHTDRGVGEIAQEFGYENESKFSAAFKKIMGDAPGVYRREHSKIHIL